MRDTAAVLSGGVLSTWYSCSVEERCVECLIELQC